MYQYVSFLFKSHTPLTCHKFFERKYRVCRRKRYVCVSRFHLCVQSCYVRVFISGFVAFCHVELHLK